MQMNRLKYSNNVLYYKHYRNWYKVRAVLISVEDTNAYLEEHEDCGLLNNQSNFYVIVSVKDKGTIYIS